MFSPSYYSFLVYVLWCWLSYRLVAFALWFGYARPYHPGVSVSFWWGQPVSLSLNFFFGGFDWQRREVRVVNVNNYYYRPPVFVNRFAAADGGRWQHDPAHRRGVDYRAPELRQRFAGAQVEHRADRQPVQSRPQPAARAAVQAQPQAQPQARAPSVAERRTDRRVEPEHVQIERRESRQTQPLAEARTQAQPQARVRAQTEAQPQARTHPQPEARPQPQARQEHRQERSSEKANEHGHKDG